MKSDSNPSIHSYAAMNGGPSVQGDLAPPF